MDSFASVYGLWSRLKILINTRTIKTSQNNCLGAIFAHYKKYVIKNFKINLTAFLLNFISEFDNLMQSDIPEEDKLSRRKEYEKLIKKQKELEKDLNNLEKKSDQGYEMALLHKYNEIKDAAQILLGAIANIEGVTVKELHERFELPIND